MSGATAARRQSPGSPRCTYEVATRTFQPVTGNVTEVACPYWFTPPPVGSPTRSAFVKRSTSAAKLPAAEKVALPISR